MNLDQLKHALISIGQMHNAANSKWLTKTQSMESFVFPIHRGKVNGPEPTETMIIHFGNGNARNPLVRSIQALGRRQL